MNKEQATQHIRACLRNGDSPEEIAIELSGILNAPLEITRRFVNQVEDSFSAESPTQATIEPDSQFAEGAEIDRATSPPQTPSEPVQNIDLPPGLQALLLENPGYIEPTKSTSASNSPSPLESDLPRQASFNPGGEASSSGEKLDDELKVNKNELAAEVLKQLKKKRRHNDIVEDICNKTGWHWNKAQRFVAQVKTKNFEELQSTQNRTTIIVGTVIILIGLVMALAGGSTLADYAKIAVFARTNPEVLLSISPEFIFFALTQTVTGIGMIVGGGYGISRAITDH